MPYARFKRAVERGNLLEADSAARELGQLNLPDALEYCDLLARFAPRPVRASSPALARTVDDRVEPGLDR